MRKTLKRPDHHGHCFELLCSNESDGDLKKRLKIVEKALSPI